MTKCMYNHCTNTRSRNPDLRFFRFPYDKQPWKIDFYKSMQTGGTRSEDWLNRCNAPKWMWKLNVEELSQMRICGEHFNDDQFMNSTKKQLKPFAVPRFHFEKSPPSNMNGQFIFVPMNIGSRPNNPLPKMRPDPLVNNENQPPAIKKDVSTSTGDKNLVNITTPDFLQEPDSSLWQNDHCYTRFTDQKSSSYSWLIMDGTEPSKSTKTEDNQSKAPKRSLNKTVDGLCCRLCEINITDKNGQLLYDLDQKETTKLGQKLNFLLNAQENYTKISNFCCCRCAMKVEACFSLLVEVKSYDEIIKQTYELATKTGMVERSKQTFTCRTCCLTILNMKSYIKHNEYHILSKPVVGSETSEATLSICDVRSLAVPTKATFKNVTSVNNKNNIDGRSPIAVNKDLHSTLPRPINNSNRPDTTAPLPVNNNNSGRTGFKLTNNNVNLSEAPGTQTKEAQNVKDASKEPCKMTTNTLLPQILTPLKLDDILEDNSVDDGNEDDGITSDDDFETFVELIKNELRKEDKEDKNVQVNISESGNFICTRCKESFDYKFLITQHMQKHNWNVEQERTIVQHDLVMAACKYCQVSFTRNDIYTHVSKCRKDFVQHNPDILCHRCGKTFKNDKTWHSHISKHGTVNGFTCELCGKKYSRKIFLKNHFAEHDESLKVICQICGMKLLKTSLRTHMHVHETVKKHICEFCGKGYNFNYLLQEHICRIHKPSDRKRTINTKLGEKQVEVEYDENGLPRYPCPQCDKKLNEVFLLKSHLQLIHHMTEKEVQSYKSFRTFKSIACPTCHKIFRSEAKLGVHVKVEHNLNPTDIESLRKTCEVCQKVFSTKQTLQVHIDSSHLNIRKLSCTYCDRKFSKHTALKVHIHSHTGEKPYECEVCGRTYRQQGDVIRHLVRHVRDGEVSLENATATNNCTSRHVRKRRVFLKDSSVKTQILSSRRKKRAKLDADHVDEYEDYEDEEYEDYEEIKEECEEMKEEYEEMKEEYLEEDIGDVEYTIELDD